MAKIPKSQNLFVTNVPKSHFLRSNNSKIKRLETIRIHLNIRKLKFVEISLIRCFLFFKVDTTLNIRRKRGIIQV